jgi:hypothetical protein
MSTTGKRSKRRTRSAMRHITTILATACTTARVTALHRDMETTEWEAPSAPAAKEVHMEEEQQQQEEEEEETSTSVARSPRHMDHPPLRHRRPTGPSLCHPSPRTLRFHQPPTQCRLRAGELEFEQQKRYFACIFFLFLRTLIH